MAMIVTYRSASIHSRTSGLGVLVPEADIPVSFQAQPEWRWRGRREALVGEVGTGYETAFAERSCCVDAAGQISLQRHSFFGRQIPGTESLDFHSTNGAIAGSTFRPELAYFEMNALQDNIRFFDVFRLGGISEPVGFVG